MKIWVVFGVGLLISGLGALPFGVLNITALDIAANTGVVSALLFALSAIAVELFYVRLSLIGNKKWILRKQWEAPLVLLGCVVMLFLGINSFMAPSGTSRELALEATTLSSIGSPILLGIMLSAINPMQFPFWLAWNKVLSKRGILNDNNNSYFGYMLGIGLGTFFALLLFIWVGQRLTLNDHTYVHYFNKVVGVIYVGFACYFFVLFYRKGRNLKLLRK